MAKQPKKKPTAVEKMIAQKKSLVARLQRDIAHIRANAEAEVGKVEQRIRIARSIMEALEKGTLKL